MSEENYVSSEQNTGVADPSVVVDVNQSANVSEEQHVPLSALQQERLQRQQLQEENRMMKDHLSLLQANQTQIKGQDPKDEFDGLRDDDVMTVGEFKKVASKFNQQVQTTVEEIRMSQKYPDYQEVISQYLPEVLKQNPSLKRTLQQTQDYELAYYLAKNSESYKTQSFTKKRSADAERIMKNANQSGSLSAIGGTSPINNAKRYKDMSDAEFRKEVAKNVGYN